jgi:glycine C-acetyltransferase
MPQDFVEKELAQLRKAGLYRSLRLVGGEQGPTLLPDGLEVVNFSSNNYLGIANHPALRRTSPKQPLAGNCCAR